MSISGEGLNIDSTVVNELVKRHTELAGDIEKTHETLSLDALRYSLSREAHHEGDDGHSQQCRPEPKPLLLGIGL